MSEEEREEILAAIYGRDEDVKGSSYDPLKSASRTRMIDVNGTKVEIPNIGYVLSLERSIVKLTDDLRKLATEFNTMRNLLKRNTSISTRNFHSQSRNIELLNAQMNEKVDKF